VNTDTSLPAPESWNDAEPVLESVPVAYMAVVEHPGDDSTEGLPYVVPVNFAYHKASPEGDRSTARLFFHTGVGRKTRALARDRHVCFAVTADISFAAGDKPCEDGFYYRSVLIWGRAKPLEDREDRLAALREIVAKYDPKAAEQPFDEHDFEQTQVYEVTIDEVSYKERPRHRHADCCR
jgi:nitroimidazol reductase NimA-like FMN-containing flavoprotein (pyridoxamine 5'-phosphate oxidase superfamily)